MVLVILCNGTGSKPWKQPPMWDELHGWNMLKWVPEVNVPCFFITGENDYKTPALLAEVTMEDFVAHQG